MGQHLSCAGGGPLDHVFLRAVEMGELELVDSLLDQDPSILHHDRIPALHIAASAGRLEVLTMLIDRSVHPNVLNRRKQTPLMLAAMHGHVGCVKRLIDAGANILLFDSVRARTCLHYAAYYGHVDCLQEILSAARSSSVAAFWGFARFVNVRDGDGATPLHLAARQRQPDCVHMLLDNGALVCASTGNYGFPGSTPLHFAARGGSLDCVRELLAWGADRLRSDSSGRIPYAVAIKRKHMACAALLNPSASEPIVWPSPLKFISELNPEAKALLEGALLEANKAREKNILKGTPFSLPSPGQTDDDNDENESEGDEAELCCICFDQPCTIEVRNCGHQMCPSCTLALCCHNKPNPATLLLPEPVCPFCRSTISQLVVAKHNSEDSGTPKLKNPRRSRHSSEGSSSFKGLTSAMGSLGKLGRGSGRISDISQMLDKP